MFLDVIDKLAIQYFLELVADLKEESAIVEDLVNNIIYEIKDTVKYLGDKIMREDVSETTKFRYFVWHRL